MAMSVHQEGHLPFVAQVIKYRVACVPNENDEDESTQHSENYWFFYAIILDDGNALQAVRFDLQGNSDTGTGCCLHQKAFGFPLTDNAIAFLDIPAAGGACLMSFIADLEWSGLLRFRFRYHRGRRHWMCVQSHIYLHGDLLRAPQIHGLLNSFPQETLLLRLGPHRMSVGPDGTIIPRRIKDYEGARTSGPLRSGSWTTVVDEGGAWIADDGQQYWFGKV